MNKINHISAFVFSVLCTVFIGQIASANTAINNHDASYITASVMAEAKCAAPLNRDYHDVLSAYNNDESDDYKFSGCGGVI